MATFTLTIRDESVPRSEIVDQILTLASAPISARDLIAERVRAECDKRMSGSDRWSYLVVSPSEEERALNGTALKPINAEAHVNTALKAFEANGFVLLVDDVQVETLDQPLTLTSDSVVTFLRLTPLVGG